MSTKAALKAAKSAWDAQNFSEVVKQANEVLSSEPNNYFGHVFLGRGLEKQSKVDEAVKAYHTATNIKPKEDLAWKGLCNTLGTQGSRKLKEYRLAALGLAQAYAEKSDQHECQTVINKLVSFTKEHGTRSEYKNTLEVLLPTSPIYDFLEGRVQSPALTYTRLAEITEGEEKERINKEIGERRTRLGAKLGQVTADVMREVLAHSKLEDLYQNIIDWSSDDELRRSYEEKLFQHAYDLLIVLPKEEKLWKRSQVTKLAHDMVIIKHPYELAWTLELEWNDIEDLGTLDRGVLMDIVSFFPKSGLSKVIQSLLGSIQVEAIQLADRTDGECDKKEEVKTLSTEERLLILAEGLEDSQNSAFAHRVASDYYLQMEDYENCVETSRRGQKLLEIAAQKSGLSFENNLDSVRTSLATSLVYYQSPKNHPEAKTLFDDILIGRPNSTSALLGIGLIFVEQEQYEKAYSFLDRALSRDPENIRIGTEAAWCKFLTGDIHAGLESLETYLPKIDARSAYGRDLRAQTSFRVGKCIWEIRADRASRKDRKGAYAHFLTAIKANPSFAPAYTSLGVYYADYANDKKRARQCLQKAFELSATETVAAELLARAFADDANWDVVEIIAARVIDTGIARPSPGSKRKGLSWPFAALGIVQMNKQDYPKSVVSFQAALRISPSGYNSWVGLGESYHSSGRYNAARKTLEHAETLVASAHGSNATWFAQYMLANVHRELGEYEGALTGYQCVLDLRPAEFGVSIALLQTLVENAWHSIEIGYFGLAAESARKVILRATKMNKEQQNSFNFWKAIGDACSTYSWIPSYKENFPIDELRHLLGSNSDNGESDQLQQLDKVSNHSIAAGDASELEASRPIPLARCLYCALLAYKRAIMNSSHDIHSQAVAWYNLGWAEHRTHACLKKEMGSNPKVTRFANAAVRCMKRAIELEPGNADFWDALGVVTTCLSPNVAQHSFVRSLYLNERSARTWANLGTLYLLQNDYELAHTAFARAQSTDPDYAHAWLGEGLIALVTGDAKEALSHFTHAVEIADASSVPVKSQYVVSAFDHLLSSSSMFSDLGELNQPIFALQQLERQAANTTAYRHLIALLQERVGDCEVAVAGLLAVCADAEAQYETTESSGNLAQFAKAKSDLARNQLAIHDYISANESAETTLDLTAEPDSDTLSPSEWEKTRLSAHLTAGLSHYYLGAMDSAIEMFRAALEESNGAADVVCLLAQVLWAKGGEEERGVAKEQLFDCIEKHPGHVRASTILGAMSAIDGDKVTLDAVITDLQSFRTSDELDMSQRKQLETLLAMLNSMSIDRSDQDFFRMIHVLIAIMLEPSQPEGWTKLSELTSEPYAPEMGLKAAMKAVPPLGILNAEQLSRAFANVDTAASAQRSIALCPWLKEGWEAFQACLY